MTGKNNSAGRFFMGYLVDFFRAPSPLNNLLYLSTENRIILSYVRGTVLIE